LEKNFKFFISFQAEKKFDKNIIENNNLAISARFVSISAFLHLNNDTFGKGEKSQRGTRKTHFFKDTPQKLTVAIGQAAVLLCRVKNLGNRTVSFTLTRLSLRALLISSISKAVCVLQ